MPNLYAFNHSIRKNGISGEKDEGNTSQQSNFRVASTIDAVLLSHSDTLHLGALSYAMKQFGLTAPIYATELVYRLGLLTMYDHFLSRKERKKLLQCSCCGQLVHLACLVPPVTEEISSSWFCHSCKEKTEEYLQARHIYLAELLRRYEEALDRKSKILDIIRAFDLPNNPLDDIIDQLGGPDNVSEITGRRGMLVRASNGKGVTYQARNIKDVTMEMVNMHEKQLFMDGKKLVAIISEAGSASVSLQADRRALNQKRMVHVTLELPWSADRAIQQFGRTHRSNQASAPEYK